MKNERYVMSFTTGGLFHRESVELAGLFLELEDWRTVRARVLSDNLLRTRTLSTAKRLCTEIISRLKKLDPREMDLLVRGEPPEQRRLLWIAVCRRHKFIAEFAVEVIRERHITMKPDLGCGDFDAFFNQKSEWRPELDKIQPSTRNKLRQVLFKILREAEILTADNTINASIVNSQFYTSATNYQKFDK